MDPSNEQSKTFFRASQKSKRICKRHFFHLWKQKLRNRILNKSRLKVIQSHNLISLTSSFEQWKILFIHRTRKIPKNTRMLNRYFVQWKEQFDKERILTISASTIMKNQNFRILMKTFNKMKRKYKIILRKREQKLIHRWEFIVKMKMKYDELIHKREIILQKQFFVIFKEFILIKEMETKKTYFNIWRLYVQRSRQKSECIMICSSLKLSRCFSKWKIEWENYVERNEINYIKSKVVNKCLKRWTFKTWHKRTIICIRRNNMKAIIFRRHKIQQNVFNEWRNYIQMNNIKANEYYRKITLKRYFCAFYNATYVVPKQKEAIAEKFHDTVLMQRYFNRLKKATVHQCDQNYQDIIFLLNNSFDLQKIKRVN